MVDDDAAIRDRQATAIRRGVSGKAARLQGNILRVEQLDPSPIYAAAARTWPATAVLHGQILDDHVGDIIAEYAGSAALRNDRLINPCAFKANAALQIQVLVIRTRSELHGISDTRGIDRRLDGGIIPGDIFDRLITDRIARRNRSGRRRWRS